MEVFLTFSSFRLMKKDRLRAFVEEVRSLRLRKNEVVFRQGEEDRRVFIVVKGEVGLEKVAELGKENPNSLYKSRLAIKRQSHTLNKKIVSIPYADFSKIYNCSLPSRKINLTRAIPISILG